MGSISQRSCHAYLPSVKYTTAEKSRRKERKRERDKEKRGRRNDFKEIMREKQTRRCNVKLRLSDFRLLNKFTL